MGHVNCEQQHPGCVLHTMHKECNKGWQLHTTAEQHKATCDSNTQLQRYFFFSF